MFFRTGERLFGSIPLLFAIQQLCEGTIWLGLSHDAPLLTSLATHVYSFFSHVLWPVYVPVAVLLIEPPGPRRRVLGALVAAGLALGLYLLAWTVNSPITASASCGHIDYESPPHFLTVVSTLYVVSTTVSLMASSHRWAQRFGMLCLIASGLAWTAWQTWFISLWCFFAAMLSTILLMHFEPHPLRRLARLRTV